MHVRVRADGVECIVVVDSKLTKIDKFRALIQDKFHVETQEQRLFYGGKLLEDGYSFHDYNIKLNDVIQLMKKVAPPPDADLKKDEEEVKDNNKDQTATPKIVYQDASSKLYRIGDLVDMRETVHRAWVEGKIVRIVKDPEYIENSAQETSQNTNGEVLNCNGKNVNLSPKKSSPQKTTPVKNKSPKSSPIKENIPVESSDNKSCTESPKTKTPTPKRGIKDYFSKGKLKETDEEVKINGHSSSNMKDIETTKQSIITTDDKNEKKIDNDEFDSSENLVNEVGLLYKVHYGDDPKSEDEEWMQYCRLLEIRPRSRKEISAEDLKTNETVLLNYNVEETHEKGFWYDFTVHEVKKNRKTTELNGTLYHGRDVPLHDVTVKLHDKVYAIETVIPLCERSEEDEKIMITTTEIRPGPLNCKKCRDNAAVLCKECGCHLCGGKNQPESILLCDECNQGFHMSCLTPPLENLPEDDWYCVDCKRDTNEVVAPGAKKQQRKPNQGHKGRDWGRGMACVGKTQTCAMPANHFGPIPGIEVGMTWRFRIQLSESGVHRPPVSGIHGRDTDGAYSIVLSGGYEDDYDDGFEFSYTGSGGRDLSGNKRTADQSSDQTLTRENKALARNCAVKVISEEGADSKDKWKDGKPVRVVRSYKMSKHFPQYAPKEGIRYDGIYKVVKYYPETGKSGFRVWKYLLRRDDPNPTPWEKGAKQYSIVYPDGYLEAEAEKQAQKEREKMKNQKTPTSKGRKRPLRESNGNSHESQEDCDKESNKKDKRKSNAGKRSSKVVNESSSPPAKKMRTRSSIGNEKVENEKPKTTPKNKKIEKPVEKVSSPSVNPFTIAAKKTNKTPLKGDAQMESSISEVLSKEDEKTVEKDLLNKKLWEECLQALESDGKKGLVDKVTTLFLCIICQEVAANPVTTTCSHNFCMPCLKLAFKNTETNSCPYCRANLGKEEITCNEELKAALRIVLPGYDFNKK